MPSPTPSRPPASPSAATARAGCCGSSRSSRSRPSAAGSATATVTEAEVGPLLDGALDGTDRCIGVVDEHEWLARAAPRLLRPGRRHRAHRPRRLPRSTAACAGWNGRSRSPPEEVVAEVTASGLRGRGGAGFPAGIKWETVRAAPSDVKFVCCNADEGDSGTFADRMLLEGDPFTLVEGMTIAALAVGATEGYVYLRSEYPHAVRTLRRAIDIAYAHGVLGAVGARQRAALRPRRAGRRRRLHLRRGDLDARVASRAGGARCGPSPRSPRSRGSSAGRPSSTTCSPWPRCRWSSPTAARRTPRWAPGARAAPRSSSSPATSPAAASSRPTSA